LQAEISLLVLIKGRSRTDNLKDKNVLQVDGKRSHIQTLLPGEALEESWRTQNGRE
jgi:hypothetical protein